MLKRKVEESNRLRIVAVAFLLLAIWIVVRLFMLQVIQHDYYALFALSSHEISEKIHPRRGTIYFQDTRTKEVFPAAINKEFYLIYAVPKEIPAAETASTTEQLTAILGIDDPIKKGIIASKLARADDVYETIAKKIPEEQVQQIKDAKLKGIYATPQQYRYYPDQFLLK